MTRDAVPTFVSVEVRGSDGLFYASSKDIAGLHICGSSEEQLCERVAAGIKVLFKHNRGYDVEVSPVTPPDQFPQLTAPCTDRFVVSLI